jgi:hypothetical protein
MTHLYSSQAYADAFREFGPIIKIDSLNIWVQIRDIPNTQLKDATSIYPLSLPTKPQSSNLLYEELKDLGLVSLVLVTAPFLDDTSWLSSTFDIAREYKTNFTVEGPVETRVFRKKHRKEIRKALTECEIRKIDLLTYLDQWCELYDTLIARHDLKGVHRFSRRYFETLANLTKISTFGAFIDDNLVSASLWVEDTNWITGHLSGTSNQGYGIGASHAIFDYLIRHYEGRNINLGGAPDNSKQGANLSLFKRGFANASRTSWLCGIIVDQVCYKNLCREMNTEHTQFFPAYRCDH